MARATSEANLVTHCNKFLVFAMLAVASCAAQEQTHRHETRRPDSRPLLRMDANLVLVPVTVTDNRGRPVTDLRRTDFTVTEENRIQEIVSFARENAPVSVGIVVDLSGSMVRKIAETRVAVKEFLNNLEPEDEEFLVTFADTPEVKLAFTSNPREIRDALSMAGPRGSTALFDAVYLAMRQMRGAQNQRKALFLVSDGGDNHSRLTERELRRLVDEEDVQIHAVGIHGGAATSEEMRGPWILDALAKMTGGQHHMVNDAAELPQLAARMSLALHDRYLLGYRPNPAGEPGTFRKIAVKLTQPKGAARLYVYARRGCRMP